MALKKEILQRIAALTKTKVEDLETAIKDEKEVDFSIDEKLNVFGEDEVTTLKENEYKRGNVSAVEIAVKDIKQKLGLEFQGKTIDGLIEAANKKALADAKVEPGKQVTELQDKITTLQKTVGEYETKLTEKDNEVTKVKINGELIKHIPAPGENGPALGSEDVIQLMRINGYDFKLNDKGVLTAYKDGKEIQDKLSNPRAAKDIVTEFLKEKKLITEQITPEGRGNGDGKGTGKATAFSELKKEFEAQGKSLLGAEFSEAVAKAVADNKDFAMDK